MAKPPSPPVVADNTMAQKQRLIAEVEKDIRIYTRMRTSFIALRWCLMIAVTIAGFFTATAGSVSANNVPLASSFILLTPQALIFWGLITSLGSMITANADLTGMALRAEHKKDAMRAVHTELVYRHMDSEQAALHLAEIRALPILLLDQNRTTGWPQTGVSAPPAAGTGTNLTNKKSGE